MSNTRRPLLWFYLGLWYVCRVCRNFLDKIQGKWLMMYSHDGLDSTYLFTQDLPGGHYSWSKENANLLWRKWLESFILKSFPGILVQHLLQCTCVLERFRIKQERDMECILPVAVIIGQEKYNKKRETSLSNPRGFRRFCFILLLCIALLLPLC